MGRRARQAVGGGIVAAALAVGTAACQEGGAAADAVASAAPATASAPVTTAPARVLRAGDYILTAGAETVGFESSGGVEDDSSDPSMRAEVAACVGVRGYNPPAPSDQTSGDTFVSTEESEFQASSRAKILPAAQISQDAQIVSSPRFGDCFRGALEKAVAGEDSQGFTYEIVAVETPPPPRGATAFVRTSMGITDENGTYGYVLDTVYFYVGQVAVELQVTNVQDVPPPTIEQGLIDQIARKLTNQ